MVELFQKKQLNRSSKPFPLINLIRGTSHSGNNGNMSGKKEELGSGIIPPILSNSIVRKNDPYMPHIHERSHSSTSLPQPKHHHHQHPVRRSTNSSTPHLVTHHSRQPVTPTNNTASEPQHIHHHHYYFSPPSSPTMDRYDTDKSMYSSIPTPTSSINQQQQLYTLYHQNTSYSSSQLPPLSPPPLSPTNVSFSTTSRPSWRNMKRSPTWRPASSISSSDEEDDDDNEPLGELQLAATERPLSLLSDASEDGDDDLVPIARLSISRTSTHHMSAAEKYKAKVRAKLHMNNTDAAFV